MAVPQPDLTAMQIAEQALDRFGEALAMQATSGATIDTLRPELRQFCVEARRAAMTPEKVLVCVKRALDGVPGLDGRTANAQAERRSQIVSFVIETYYEIAQRDD